jgi:protein-S-isoprenylcysteine O-methyltransferase Ste14
MRAPVFLWPYGLVFWVVFVWAFLPELILVTRARRGADSHASKDAGSLRLIVRGMWVALIAAFPLSLVEAARMAETTATITLSIGTVLLIAGSVLRRLCWRTLGRYFTGDVQVRPDQPVIDHGPYRWVRHPSYTGGMIMFAGVGVALSNWLSLFVLVITSVAVYSYRVAVEERVLIETIGPAYVDYMKRTRRFIPYIL